MSWAIEFFVPGKPQPAGSKRAFPFKKKNGKLGVAVSDDNPKSHDWKSLVKLAAHEHRPDSLLQGPLEMELWFHVERPKHHFGSGRRSKILKPSAPTRPTKKPDTTKLTRCVEDGLTGIIWSDDAQIVDQHCHKVFADSPGVFVKIREVI